MQTPVPRAPLVSKLPATPVCRLEHLSERGRPCARARSDGEGAGVSYEDDQDRIMESAREISVLEGRMMDLEGDITTLEAQNAELKQHLVDYEKRFQRITNMCERLGWEHCTTEVELIEQVESLVVRLAGVIDERDEMAAIIAGVRICGPGASALVDGIMQFRHEMRERIAAHEESPDRAVLKG